MFQFTRHSCGFFSVFFFFVSMLTEKYKVLAPLWFLHRLYYVMGNQNKYIHRFVWDTENRFGMGWGFVFRSTEIFSRLCICWPLEYIMFRTILVVWWMTQKHDVYYSVPLCNFHITTLILFIFVCPWWIKALQVICRNRLFVFSLCDCVSEGQAVIRHDYSISTGLFSSLARTWPTGQACVSSWKASL